MTGVMRRAVVGMLVAATCVLTTGCSNGVSLNRSEYDIPVCENLPARIPVADLNEQKRVKCSSAGARVVFPDGTTLRIPKVSRSFGRTVASKGDKRLYDVANLGVYGTVAAFESNDHKRLWWGSPEGVQKSQAGCGSPCD